MFDLSGKIALVTGATGGIGQAITKVLYEAGAKVAITGTREAILDDIASFFGEDVVPFVANLSHKNEEEKGRKNLIQAVCDYFGRLDILVNNAGITRDNLVMRMKDQDWDDVLDINLTASFQLIRASLRGMLKQRFGRVINITSVVGVSGNAGQTNYAASKAGIIGMSKSLAQEVASKGITVNCIAPGFIKTPMTDKLNAENVSALLDRIPAKKLGDGKDIAMAVLYLSSDESSYVTGQTLHVNGGMIMI